MLVLNIVCTINYLLIAQNEQGQPYSGQTGSSTPSTAYPDHSVSTDIYIRKHANIYVLNLPHQLKTRNYDTINLKRTHLLPGYCGVLQYEAPAESTGRADRGSSAATRA